MAEAKKTTGRKTTKPKAPEKAAKEEPKKDLITATASGDRLEALIALRDFLARRLQHAQSSRDVAAISRRLMQCLEEIEKLEKAKKAKLDRPARVVNMENLGRQIRKGMQA